MLPPITYSRFPLGIALAHPCTSIDPRSLILERLNNARPRQDLYELRTSFIQSIKTAANMDSAEVSTAVNEPLDLVKLSLSECVQDSHLC